MSRSISPKNCFIDRRAFASMEELYAFLKGMKKEEYETYLANIRVFLSSDTAREKFTQRQLDEDFARAVLK